MDIAIAWDKALGEGDWTLSGGGLALNGGLESAVLVSLFTDQRASDDFVPPDGSGDRRGWWGDTFEGDQIGSRLWQLDRRFINNRDRLGVEMRKAAEDALQWLVDDGIASAVTVTTGWLTPNTGAIAVRITMPDGRLETFNYAFAWTGTT